MENPWSVRELKIPMDAEYNWSVGGHMEKFIRGLRNRKILGVRCPSCNRVFVPPRMICERCFDETGEWVEVGPEGTIQSYTVGYVSVDPSAGGLRDLEEPEIVALIRPDGADSGMVHRIGEARPEEMEIKMRVQAVWAEETSGDLTDLIYYKPVR